MADVIITLNIMPTSPDVDLKEVTEKALSIVKEYTGMDNNKVEEVPLAFGLKAIKLMFVMDEAKGATDPLEEQIKTIDGVNSVEVTDVRRSIG
jgi:elongation factor 1-beta